MEKLANDNATAADFDLSVVLRALASFVEDHFGADKLNEILEASGLQPANLHGPAHWGSVEQIDTFYSLTHELLGRDDQAFVEAAGYNLLKSLGPMRYIVAARSPEYIYERAIKELENISTISRVEIVELAEQSSIHRYITTKPESRLICLVRQGMITTLPTLWGLPKAKLKETACVGHGDDYCEFHLSWYQPRRYLWQAIGLLCGIATFGLGYAIDPAWAPYLLTPAVFFPLLGHLMDVRKANAANLDFSDKLTAETRALLYTDAEARREILELNERQRDWEKIETQGLTQTTAERQVLIEQLAGHQTRLAKDVSDYGHDIESPLTVLKAHSSILRKAAVSIDEAELAEILQHNDAAVDKINGIVGELMAAAKSQKTLKNVVPEEIDVHELAARLERRVQALVHGTAIETRVIVEVSVLGTLETDRLMLDRVIDNLLMNAAKHTVEGRVDVFIVDRDGEFSLEVRDTGPGIAEEELCRILEPAGADGAPGLSGSFGSGLWVVGELLDQLGGRLVVESEPEKGSSFKVILPFNYHSSHGDDEDAASVERDT